MRLCTLLLVFAVPFLVPAARAGAMQAPPILHEVTSPAGAASGEPSFAAGDSGLYLSWIEKDSEGRARVMVSGLEKHEWGPARTVTAESDLFVNWADFPNVLALDNGMLAAAWFRKSGKDPYAYDVRVSTSKDDGVSWSEPVSPHRDKTKTEHGFVTLLEDGPERFWIVWLDGRNHAGHAAGHEKAPAESPETQLRAAPWKDGHFGEEVLLDPRVCDCCQTAGASTGGNYVVAYRDRGHDGLRDVSFVRYAGGAWTESEPLAQDGWKIDGCPVNGPAMSARGGRVAVAWFTDAGEKPKVQIAFSDRGTSGFTRTVRVDEGNPLGRVDVEWLADDEVIVCWIEQADTDAEICVRRVSLSGKSKETVVVVPTSLSRASGFPRIAFYGGELWLAWTDTSVEPARVRVGTIQP